MPRSRLLALAIAQGLVSPAFAAMLTVDTVADAVAADGQCSLREAIENANTDSQNGRAGPGECAAGDGADVVLFDATLFAGTQTLMLSGGQMTLTSPISIQGTGEDRLIIDAGASSRHFLIDDGNDASAQAVSLSDITLQNGRTTAPGGGSVLDREHLTLTSVTLSGNTAFHTALAADGGALAIQQNPGAAPIEISLNQISVRNNVGGRGGGIHADLRHAVSPGSLSLQQCILEDNIGRLYGGGGDRPRGGGLLIEAGSAEVVISDSTVQGNSTDLRGGGVEITAGPNASVQLQHTTISDNRASRGGGLYLEPGSAAMVISDCSVQGNSSGLRGGGVAIAAGPNASVLLQHTTVSGNTAAGGGGFDVLAYGMQTAAEVVISDGIIMNNAGGGLRLVAYSGANIRLRDSTISGNTLGGGLGSTGGGVFAYAYATDALTRVSIEGSTISGNSSGGNGGGLAGTAYSSGGSAEIEVLNSTLSGNTTAQVGGGAHLRGISGAAIRIDGSTVTGNAAGNTHAGGGLILYSDAQIDLQGSVVAANQASTSPDIHLDSGALLASDSLIGDGDGSGLAEAPLGSSDGNNNLIGSATGAGVIDARLGALADYGGMTLTHFPEPDSPLIDHFDGCSGTDQTGRARGSDADGVPGDDCDVGAVEFIVFEIFADGFEDGPLP